MQYSRKMGLDFGKARIGIAFSVGSIASAHHIYQSKDEHSDLKYLSDLIRAESVDEVVMGLPLNADGTECEMTEVVKNFATRLSELAKIKVSFQDERYTSFEAEELLKEARIPWEKRKQFLDKISAQIILQNYLDANPKN